MAFILKDLGIAYRKAKVDLYYSSNPPLSKIADYEEKLLEHLTTLLAHINGADETWVEARNFLGTWSLATKSVSWSEEKNSQEERDNGLIFSSPAEKWEHVCRLMKNSSKPKAEFRVMAQCSLDFHVLSALWILKVGHLYDHKLTSCAYGGRLRRAQDGQRINEISLGSFVPYLKPFRDWRDKGIAAMRLALESGKKIVALTADITSFYHELNPGFMCDPAFLKDVLLLDLSEEENKLNRLFIRALEAWSRQTPLKKGLPVGLPASAVVANMALIELDRLVERQVVPLYYGRYVDDILLVMENGAGFRSAAELWEWLFARSSEKLAWVEGKERRRVCFRPDYLRDGKSFSNGKSESRIHFANDKNKVFILTKETGKTLVDAIAHQIRARASEWRAMPHLPRSARRVETDLLAATQSDGEAADNLRKTDALTMRRADFAINLRDFEAYERDLAPESWIDHRRTFFRAFVQHVLALPQFFELAIYLPRVIRLATACEDFADLREILNTVNELYAMVARDCTIRIKAWPEGEPPPSAAQMTRRWANQLFTTARESIMAAFPPRLSKVGRLAWQEYMADWHPATTRARRFWPPSAAVFQSQQARLFTLDLAHMPFRFIGLPVEMVAQRGIPRRKTIVDFGAAKETLPENVWKGIELLAKWIRLKKFPSGLLFATRPFSLPELYVLGKEACTAEGRPEMEAIVLSLRGFRLSEEMPIERQGVLKIPVGGSRPRCAIAVSSWTTRLDSWTAAVTRSPDPDTGRYSRLNRLLDGVIKDPQRTRYLILPELALPAHWFIRIARKLHARGISLITGIEYLHNRKGRVRNQVWAALSHDGLGFPSIMIYRQDKQRPALHEERELQRLAGVRMRPDKKWREPPIIQHGDVRFALLVCSELTNIGYRAALRGQIDALFVPEWNQDIETFNALVESAALDIHAYIVQCNHRQYGDSRIRAPYTDSWMRDLLRVKGGIVDYCVIGEIDVQALRQFQSSYRSSTAPFKPVPDGFEIHYLRRVLPVGKTKP